LERTLRRLAQVRPSFISVTYGAGGTTRGPTEEIVHHIQHELGVTAMPHLTCVSHTRAEIELFLDRYRRDGIENVLALRGDMPAGSSEQSAGHFQFATELVAIARERGQFTVGVAAHPETHPMAGSREADLAHQAAKIAAADFAMTQFFFASEHYERFCEELALRGVFVPVIPGIMPPTNAENVGRMAALNRTDFPSAIRDRLVAAGDDLVARREIGVEVATRLAEALLAAGAPGLHIYTMNFSEAPLEIVSLLGVRRRPR
jgi:methylenetetrahydrofolate reductase (NADPH)